MKKQGRIFIIFTCLFFIFLVFFFDQLLKFIALSISESDRDFLAFGDIFRFTLSRNSGIAFGLGLFPRVLVIIITVILLCAIVYFLFKSVQRRQSSLAFWQAMIVAGGSSNLLDRIVRGQVIDYLFVRWYSSFNLADVAIVVGALGWILLCRREDGNLRV